MLGNTNYDQEAGVYVARGRRRREAIGASREQRRDLLAAPVRTCGGVEKTYRRTSRTRRSR